MREPILGCIADDFTGAVDVATGAHDAGLNAVVVTGDSLDPMPADADVIVVALKTRTVDAADAVDASRAAARGLLEAGAHRIYFKYCSTFDSTPDGNIGPVADDLADLLGQRATVFAPGYPVNGRTVRNGMLYVGERLLSNSPMRHHPSTPMTSSDVPALLAAQSRRWIAAVGLGVVQRGPGAIRNEIDQLAEGGAEHIVMDTVTDDDIAAIARAVAHDRFVTGGAALAVAIAAQDQPAREGPVPTGPPVPYGRPIVLSGSCSEVTRAQVERFAADHSALRLTADDLADPDGAAASAVRWAVEQGSAASGPPRPVLISTTTGPEEVRAAQDRIGTATLAARADAFFSAVAERLLDNGLDRVVVAGGETSGAVAHGLGVREMQVVAPIGPGLAWCVSSAPPVALALKSGNFGDPDMFRRAHEILDDVSALRSQR